MACYTTSTYPAFKPAAPALISLRAARCNPDIVYRSVEHLDKRAPAPTPAPRPGLISLADAQKNHSIVYRSVEHLDQFPPVFMRPVPRLQSSLPLVPLYVAAARSDIKYRREGYEMVEHRRHILAVRADRG